MNKIFARSMYLLATLASVGLALASYYHLAPLDLTEVFGFITGGWCVWLTVKENIWNWPIGIANNVFFVILFWNSHLYADMALQVVYIVLSILGWYWWLRGGKGKTELPVGRTTLRTAMVLLVLGIASTWGMTLYLRTVADTAPFLDALTTVMSLIAQYLLTKKLIENWFVWLSADVIYVGLYIYKHLYLTSILYGIFFLMCIAGYIAWKKSMRLTAIEADLALRHV